MDVTRKIKRPLADEHVIGVDPPMRPELPGVWRRRINPFGGRALGAKALTAEQDRSAGMQRLQGLALAPGSVSGLELLLDPGARGQRAEDAVFHLAPGLGLAQSGEDVSIGAARRMAFGDLPVILRVDHSNALRGEGAPIAEDQTAGVGEADQETGSLSERLRPAKPRELGPTLADIAANSESAGLPHVGILVAQPVSATILGRPLDDCPHDPRDDPYVDLQRVDGCRLAFYLWPSEMSAVADGPDYVLPPEDEALRNRLAYRVFDNEKLLLPGEMHPWEEWGVPLGLAAFDDQWRLSFLDRFSVVRTGGTPRPRTPLVPQSGEPRLWQARIDQFVAHLADMDDLGEESLRRTFVRMPPVGLLPKEGFDPVLRRQHFFPASFGVSAVPIARSNLEVAAREAAPLASLNRNTPDRVELLLPVPDHLYDPNLLEVELEDPRFAQAIRAFRQDRTLWLARRESARRRYDRLLESVSGQVAGWPAEDLGLEENCPAPRTQPPAEVTRTRRISGQGAQVQTLTGARASLPVAQTDTIWLWVRVHSATGLTGLSLRLGTGTAAAHAGPAPVFDAGLFWGAATNLPIATQVGGGTDRRVGDLPEPGVWHRLEIPASRVWRVNAGTLGGFVVDAAEFAQNGGDVEWGSFGKTDSAGKVYTWLGDDAPPGSTLRLTGPGNAPGAGWPWKAVAGREALSVPDFGTVGENGARRVGAVDAFKNQWKQDFLAAEMAAIDESGISAFLSQVDARLKATNDAIDLGFVRARADIYRVRQIMLGADAASRLVTSPALADLAVRDESARATGKGISEFLTGAMGRKAAGLEVIPELPDTASSENLARSIASVASAIEPVRIERFHSPSMTLNIGSPASARSTGSILASGVTAGTAHSLSNLAGGLGLTGSGLTDTGTPLASSVATQYQARAPYVSTIAVARYDIASIRVPSFDIRRQLPIAGLVERTVSVAERLKPAPAVQAVSYAIATKQAVLGTLAGLSGNDPSRPVGVPLGDIVVPGFGSPDVDDPPTLAKVLAERKNGVDSDSAEYPDLDRMPAGQKHEAEYFSAAVETIDNVIALMRLVEGRVALFEELSNSLSQLGDEIEARGEEALAWLRSIAVEIDEARHDIGMAERLRAEEAARVEATNARRAAILSNAVGTIAWRRVRAAGHRHAVPTLEIASGLAPDPVASCLREHDDVPEEIHDYVELMRDAPVKWFPALSAAVARIERLEAARAAIEKMRERAALPIFLAAPTAVTAAPRFLRGVQQALVAQRRVVEDRRANVGRLNLSLLHNLSLLQAQVQIRETASLADLIGGRHRQPVLTRMAAEEIDGISHIAGCLHESFGQVPPALRLGWAEMLSEFDRPAPLDALAGLPGWPEVPMELRRTLQGFVDWLFARIDRSNSEAVNAVNELVRIALLMAAHSPVDALIPARLVTPMAAKVGSRFQLSLDIGRVRKGMIAIIRDRDDRLVSRAVVEDVVEGHASAVLTHNVAGLATLTADLRFHLLPGGR